MSTTPATDYKLGRINQSSTVFKMGRLARTHDKRIPMMRDLLKGATLPPPPPQVDYTVGMPANLGVMKNDTLGDCTCAAYYHALQVWSYNSQHQIDTEPDIDVVDLYEQACGYNPNQPGEGPGGNEQHVLTFLLNRGAPTAPPALSGISSPPSSKSIPTTFPQSRPPSRIAASATSASTSRNT